MRNQTKYIMLPNPYLLLYSCSQRAFHIETLKDAVSKGLQALREIRKNDYVPVAAGTREEVIEGMKILWSLQSEREVMSDLNGGLTGRSE